MRLYLLAASTLASATVLLSGCQQQPQAQAPVVPSTQLTAVNTPPPEYPEHIACAGVGGTTLLKVKIASNGQPADVVLGASSGNAELDQSAIKAVRDWEFKAATRNGQPWVQTINVPVTFNPPVEKPTRCFAIQSAS